MTRIPHSAAEHLRRMAPAGDHPDANLLSAFAEGALSAAERGTLMQHLSACADCRESLALTQPEQPEVLPAGHEVGAWWLRWPFLRWAGLAASMAVVAGVLMLQIARQRNEGFAAMTDVPAPAAPAAAARTEPEKARIQEELKSADEQAPARERALDKEAAVGDRAIVAKRQQSRALETAGGSIAVFPKEKPVAPPPPVPLPQPAAPARADAPSQLADAREQKKDQAFMRDPIVPSPPVERDDIRPATTGAFAQDTRRSNEGGFFISESNLSSVDATKETRTETLAAKTAVGQPVSPAQPAPPGATSEMSVITDSQKAEMARSRYAAAPGALAAGRSGMSSTIEARWRLVNGELQRSFDEGRNWEGVPIAGEVAPLAVDARAPIVWVAGDKRDLYHSSDNGLRWQRVQLPDALTGDVREIKARDRLRVDLTTSTGERWTTEDGGKTWERK